MEASDWAWPLGVTSFSLFEGLKNLLRVCLCDLEDSSPTCPSDLFSQFLQVFAQESENFSGHIVEIAMLPRDVTLAQGQPGKRGCFFYLLAWRSTLFPICTEWLMGWLWTQLFPGLFFSVTHIATWQLIYFTLCFLIVWFPTVPPLVYKIHKSRDFLYLPTVLRRSTNVAKLDPKESHFLVPMPFFVSISLWTKTARCDQ